MASSAPSTGAVANSIRSPLIDSSSKVDASSSASRETTTRIGSFTILRRFTHRRGLHALSAQAISAS
ncbi:hypothetical protein [Variovorax sp. UC122_21]|uniref:hypothetical protein n=1 Tax=Variovorax sp. UC122_21 TaxID=3374554 RepID=UPI0037571EFB